MTEVLAVLTPIVAQAYIVSPLVWWALVFFVIAVIAYVLGAQGVAGMSASIGRTLLFVFLVLAIVFALIGFLNRTA